jgi:Spy/CpxP family protein refolding chaperone
MKKYSTLVLASVFILSVPAMAQDQTPATGKNNAPTEIPQQGPRKQLTAVQRAENMAKELNLTDAEKAKVQEVYEKNDVIFTKFRAEVNRDSPDYREKFKALRDAQDADLLKVIGKEKFDKWQTIQKERREKMMNR